MPQENVYRVVGMYGPLTTERMSDTDARRLARLAQVGDTYARDKLVLGHMRLMASMADAFWSRYQSVSNQDDVFQEAALCMLERVVPSYRPDGDVPFESWVMLKLRFGLGDYIRRDCLPYANSTDLAGHSVATWCMPPDYSTRAYHVQLLTDTLVRACAAHVLSAVDAQALRMQAAGYASSTIAEELGTTRFTLSRRLRAALERLKAWAN